MILQQQPPEETTGGRLWLLAWNSVAEKAEVPVWLKEAC